MSPALKGWIGVDFDGTLSQYTGWKGLCGFGDPVPMMLLRVKAWLSMGYDVRIVTARGTGVSPAERKLVMQALDAWCEKHIGRALPVTSEKDFDMAALWDDKAVSVETNTGERLDGHPGALDPESAGLVERPHRPMQPFLFKLLVAFAEAERHLVGYVDHPAGLPWDEVLDRVEKRANIFLSPSHRAQLIAALEQKVVTL